MNRESLEFGHGSFVGAVMEDPTFFDLSTRDQARLLAWADSCPVVEELTDPANLDSARGPEAMLNRYGQVNFWFGYINREVQESNPDLYNQLMTPVPRLETEPVGKHERESVPDSYFTEMAPMSTLAGYSLPRLFIEQIGAGRGNQQEEVSRRLKGAQEALERAINQATTPNELLALTAEGIAGLGNMGHTKILGLIMSKGWLGEHNATTMLNDFKDCMSKFSPSLWRAYSSLSVDEKNHYKLA